MNKSLKGIAFYSVFMYIFIQCPNFIGIRVCRWFKKRKIGGNQTCELLGQDTEPQIGTWVYECVYECVNVAGIVKCFEWSVDW